MVCVCVVEGGGGKRQKCGVWEYGSGRILSGCTIFSPREVLHGSIDSKQEHIITTISHPFSCALLQSYNIVALLWWKLKNLSN